MVLATIVQLIGVYKASRDRNKNESADEFHAWLTHHGFNDIADQVADNAGMLTAIDGLLQRQHDEVMGELSRIGAVVSRVAAGMDALSGLAGVMPSAALSDQALSVLRQFNERNAGGVLQVASFDNPIMLLFLDAPGGVEIGETRFIEDDLKSMVELGLLRHEYNSKGENIYRITRAGAEVGKSASWVIATASEPARAPPTASMAPSQ
ncbi:MAG: hypothetical protein AAF750_08880 [Planctomycetota bacterium]